MLELDPERDGASAVTAGYLGVTLTPLEPPVVIILGMVINSSIKTLQEL